jgi:hypothetical protein
MKESQFPAPTKHSKTRKGTRQNDSKKKAVVGSGKGKLPPALGFNPTTKEWDTQSHGK